MPLSAGEDSALSKSCPPSEQEEWAKYTKPSTRGLDRTVAVKVLPDHIAQRDDLRARIEQGALPLDQALKLAAQIADALDRAHRAGVTHRDVGPQNTTLDA